VKTRELRVRGPKPGDVDSRVLLVSAAVKALVKIGAAFSVADVAERAGISRATLYRSQALRALVGAKGDGPRTVDATLHEKLEVRCALLKTKAGALRRQLAELDASWEVMRERAKLAEQKLSEAERRVEILLSQMRGSTGGALGAVAARLGQEERRRARRILARALHPDLFAQDHATAVLATELLKTLNALAE